MKLGHLKLLLSAVGFYVVLSGAAIAYVARQLYVIRAVQEQITVYVVDDSVPPSVQPEEKSRKLRYDGTDVLEIKNVLQPKRRPIDPR